MLQLNVIFVSLGFIMKCNKLNHIDYYKHLLSSNDPWYCFSCCSKIFPFGTLRNKDFISSITATNSFSQGTNSDKDKESLPSLKPPSDLVVLYNQFSNTSPEKNNDPENVVNSKFYDIDRIQTLKFPDKYKSLSLLHINACSLNRNLSRWPNLLKCTKKIFDIIAVSETRITKQTSLTTNINLKNYAIEFTPTESSAGGTLLYIACHLSYKPHPNLNIYKADQSESTFVEIINPQKVILSLVVFTNIQIWMYVILKITISTKFLKFYSENENRSFFLVTLI